MSNNNEIVFDGVVIRICGLHIFGSEWGPVMDCSKGTDEASLLVQVLVTAN